MTTPGSPRPRLRSLAARARCADRASRSSPRPRAACRLGWSWADALDAFVLTNAVMGLAFGGCGALLAWHRPGNPIGWLFLRRRPAPGRRPPLRRRSQEVLAGRRRVDRRAAADDHGLRLQLAVGDRAVHPARAAAVPRRAAGRPRRWRWVVVAVVVTAPLFVLEMGAAPEPVERGRPDRLPHAARATTGSTRSGSFAELRTLAAYLLALRRPGRPLPARHRDRPAAAAVAGARRARGDRRRPCPGAWSPARRSRCCSASR